NSRGGHSDGRSPRTWPLAPNALEWALARAAQRAGWNVLTLHYRGSWGSPGSYSFTHCLGDAAAAVGWLRDARSPAAPNIDRTRIVVVGHSLGGFIAAYLAGHDRRLAGAALISARRYLCEVVFLRISSIGGSTPLLRSKSRNAT